MSDNNNFSKAQSRPVSDHFEREWNRLFGDKAVANSVIADKEDDTGEPKKKRFTGYV